MTVVLDSWAIMRLLEGAEPAAYAMSYASAFAAATAVQLKAELWTGDPELMATGRHWAVHNPS